MKTENVGERPDLDSALLESVERFLAIFENSVMGIAVIDPQGRIIEANGFLLGMLGYELTEVREQCLERFLAAQGEGRSLFQELMAGTDDTCRAEAALARKDGTLLFARLAVSLVRHGDGAPHFAVVMLEDVTPIEQAKARMQHMAMHDELTDLPNRALFQIRLRQAIAQARRQGTTVALHYLDIDQFKKINDTFGHPAGDQFIRMVAERLVNAVRETDTVSRLGGDEFAVIQTNMMQPRDAAVMARKLLELIRHPFLIEGHRLFVTTSIGITLSPGDEEDPDQMLKNADLALYKAKGKGRNNFQFFSSSLDKEAKRRLQLEDELHGALQRGEISLHYQPRVNLATRRVVGAEALLRWNHPRWGMIPPAEFIPIAEDSRQILTLGKWALFEACRQNKAWLDASLPGIRMAVNLSAVQFRRSKLLEQVCEALARTGLAPELLELEITEGVLMQDTEATIATLREFKAMGIELAIDDFGTGYSSLSYLTRFPLGVLKIDRSFVIRLAEDERSCTIARTIIGMGHNLGLSVIAEGVETKEQLDFLESEGCDEIQGYYFAHPLPAAEFLEFLKG